MKHKIVTKIFRILRLKTRFGILPKDVSTMSFLEKDNNYILKIKLCEKVIFNKIAVAKSIKISIKDNEINRLKVLWIFCKNKITQVFCVKSPSIVIKYNTQLVHAAFLKCRSKKDKTKTSGVFIFMNQLEFKRFMVDSIGITPAQFSKGLNDLCYKKEFTLN